MSDSIGERHLAKTLTWRDGVAIALTIPGALFSTFGYLLGVVSAWTAIAIWVAATLVGLLQNKLFAEMASMFPRSSGGVARYAMEGWKSHFAPLGAIAAFGYWLGWSLSISMSAVVFGQLIVATWFPESTLSFTVMGNQLGLPHVLAVIAMVFGWLFNYFGMKLGASVNKVLGVVVVLGLVVVAAGSFVSPDANWSASGLSWGYAGDWRTVVVVFYVTAWATYGTEICASFAPEYQRTSNDTAKALRYSSLLMVAIFFVVPTAVAGSIGEDQVAANPVNYIVVALDKAMGGAGWIGTTIIAASLLVAIISTTADGGRALYGLAQEGMTIRQLDWLNRWGVPGRSLTIDVVLNISIMLLVGSPISILLASNFGYLLSITLALAGFVLLRRDRPNWPRPIKRSTRWVAVAVILVIFNGFVTTVGFLNPGLLGYGGFKQSLAALGVLLLSVVLYAYRQIVQDKAGLVWRLPAPEMPSDADAEALAAEVADANAIEAVNSTAEASPTSGLTPEQVQAPLGRESS